MRMTSMPTCTLVRNEPYLDLNVIAEMVPSVNDRDFCGVSPHKVLMAGINAVFEPRGNGGYWIVTYEMRFNLSRYGWETPVANVGLVEWREVEEVPEGEDPPENAAKDHFQIMVPARDSDGVKVEGGVPTPEPLPLDFDGRKASEDFLKEHGIIYGHFQRYRWMDFTPLDLEHWLRSTTITRVRYPTGA